jgi:phosphoribosylamine--glycine ligase
MASRGYPGPYEKGHPISGLRDAAAEPGVIVFHAGTTRRNDQAFTDGGRVLGVTALGPEIQDAVARAYRGVKKIHWEGVHYRTDIGVRALARSS